MAKKSIKREFNVINWDFNHDKLVHYDVLPYFRECYKRRKDDSKKKRIQKAMEKYPSMKKYYGVPQTRDEFKEFIKSESQYMFWARCEYEVIVQGWPTQKNEHKLDVHEQIMMNLETVTDILFDELVKKD